jgi:hypothetical protein
VVVEKDVQRDTVTLRNEAGNLAFIPNADRTLEGPLGGMQKKRGLVLPAMRKTIHCTMFTITGTNKRRQLP